MSSERVRALKHRMDDLATEWEAFDLDPGDATPLLERAVEQFRAAGPELLEGATPHLWAYYRRERAAFTPEEREDHGIPEIAPTDDIWDHVDFSTPPLLYVGGGKLEPAASYLVFSGDASWEPEHGIDLVFEEGQRLGKVGRSDGNLTHAFAFGDESLLGVIALE